MLSGAERLNENASSSRCEPLVTCGTSPDGEFLDMKLNFAGAEVKTSLQRHDWQRGEVESIYRTPLPSLIFRAQTVHREFHPEDRVQTCQLLSIKTGGCPEDCAYCPQSAHYDTPVGREGLMAVDDVIARARRAAGEGVTRMCMGAAWRDAPDGPEFEAVLRMVRGVADLGLEVCCTLGML